LSPNGAIEPLSQDIGNPKTNTLVRAKATLNIQSTRRTFLGNWYWHLPNDTREPNSSLDIPGLPNLTEMLGALAK